MVYFTITTDIIKYIIQRINPITSVPFLKDGF